MANPFIQPKTLVRQATQYVVRNQLVVDGLPETVQDLCLEEKLSLLKDFMVTSGSVVVREMNQYDDDDMSFEKVKNGKYKVYHEPCNLYVVHSGWFERSDLGLENLSDVLSKQNWIKSKSIFVECGYIGVLENLDDEDVFEAFFWECHSEIDAHQMDEEEPDSFYYVCKIGVVSDAAHSSYHDIFTLNNKNGETVGIRIRINPEDLSYDEDYDMKKQLIKKKSLMKITNFIPNLSRVKRE